MGLPPLGMRLQAREACRAGLFWRMGLLVSPARIQTGWEPTRTRGGGEEKQGEGRGEENVRATPLSTTPLMGIAATTKGNHARLCLVSERSRKGRGQKSFVVVQFQGSCDTNTVRRAATRKQKSMRVKGFLATSGTGRNDETHRKDQRARVAKAEEGEKWGEKTASHAHARRGEGEKGKKKQKAKSEKRERKT